jgi:hypothetical protein
MYSDLKPLSTQGIKSKEMKPVIPLRSCSDHSFCCSRPGILAPQSKKNILPQQMEDNMVTSFDYRIAILNQLIINNY